jgi:ABC-type sugar transport system permease subunit
MIAPALATVLILFAYPLGYSLVSAFTARNGEPSFENFGKTFAIFGPLANLALWGGDPMVFSAQAAADLRLSILGRGIQADERRVCLSRHQHRNCGNHRARLSAARRPGRLCARSPFGARTRFDPVHHIAAAGVPERCDLSQHRPGVFT